MTDQLTFDWPPTEALGEEDFFVTSANAEAHAALADPAAWPGRRLALVGPTGCGKTHLARLFANRHGAAHIGAPQVAPDDPLPEAHAVVIDDADQIGQSAEEWLFHVHNHLVGPGRSGCLLLTAATPPARWPITLPDLASRMQAVPLIRIAAPDDALLAAVLMKQFQDRQLAPTPAALAHLLRHMTRSFAAARSLVARLDAVALGQGRDINLALVREILDNGGSEAQ